MRGSKREPKKPSLEVQETKKRTRRANHEGTFEQLPSGKWSCYVRMGGKKVRGVAAWTRQEASENLRARIDNHAAESAASGLSLMKCAEAWREDNKAGKSPTTLETEGSWIRSLGADPLGAKAANAVTDIDLAAWKRRQRMANETLRKRCYWLNQILEASGSSRRVTVPSKQDTERRPLDEAERPVLSERMRTADPMIVLGAILCWWCGLRRSEACGFSHEDVIGDGFYVTHVALLLKGEVRIRKKGKTPKAKDWIAVPPALQGILGKGHGFVLSEDGGKTPMNPRSLSYHLGELVKGTPLENIPYMGLHALRRTYGQTLLEDGADIVTAAGIMRHDPEMLAKQYARSRQDLKRKAVARSFGGELPHQLPQESVS